MYQITSNDSFFVVITQHGTIGKYGKLDFILIFYPMYTFVTKGELLSPVNDRSLQ